MRQGGVAYLARHEAPVIPNNANHPEMGSLYEETRWEHYAIPYQDGTKAIHLEAYYAISSPNGDDIKLTENDRNSRRVFSHVESLGRAPVLICVDLNSDPEEIDIVMKAIAKNEWCDLGVEYPGPNGPRRTFNRSGPYEDMEGPQCTRIDAIFTNREAPQHTPLRVTLNLDRYDAQGWTPKVPRPFRVQMASD